MCVRMHLNQLDKIDPAAVAQLLGSRFDAVSTDGVRALEELNLPPDAAILDVGTGSGNFAIFLASQGYRVLTGEPATDTSQYSGRDWAPSAEKVGVRDRIRFQHFDAGDLPFASGSFDAVFFFGVLHHIPEPQRPRVLSEALRVAKQNGAVVFLEPRAEMLRRVRVDDPAHPEAADPSAYVTGVREQRIEGVLMDTYIFRKSAA